MAEHELNKIVDDDGEVFNLRDSTKQPTADRVTSWGSTPSDTKYPSEKLVKDSLDGKVSVSDVKNASWGVNILYQSFIAKNGTTVDNTNKTITATYDTSKSTDVYCHASTLVPIVSGETYTISFDIIDSNLTEGQYWTWSFLRQGRANVKITGNGHYSITVVSSINIHAGYSALIDDYDKNLVNGSYIVFKNIKYEIGKFETKYSDMDPLLVTGSNALSTTLGPMIRALGSWSIPYEGEFIPAASGSSQGKYTLRKIFDFFKSLMVSDSGVNISGNAATATTAAGYTSGGSIDTALQGKVDKETGKGLSTNDYTTTEKNKLAGIASGAEVNVQSDWNQATTTADDYIKNKPTLGTAAAKDVPTSGNASATQVVMGNDSRLTDARTPTAHTHTADAADVVDQQGDSTITDSTDIITTHVNGYSSTNKKLYKRNFKDYVWPWIKDKISSVLGLSTTGYTGNAATATKATQDSDGNAINATYFKSSGNTTLVAGAATKIGTQNGADVKLTLPAHQDISGKMNTSASNAASGALQNLTGQLTEGTYDFTDNTEMFTSYAGNSGFAESGHVNQPYRRKASSMLNYIESKRFYTRNPAQNSVGTGTKRIQLGYALKSGAGYCNYLVHVFFNIVDGSLTGCGVTLLVNYDWNTTSQKAKCVILNDNGLRAAGYNIVLANFLSNDGTNQWMHITLGLVNNSAPGTLVAFTYSYCGIFRVNSDVNWVPSIASDTVGSYDQLVQAVLTDADTVDGYHIQFGSYSSRSDTISFY